MRLGSFVTFPYVDSVIFEEKKSLPRRRQVVSILLLKPGGKAICLAMSERAQIDGRLNLSPPQGEIENESLQAAAVRELREELDVGVDGRVRYLGSIVRSLLPDHKRAKQFDEFHHHWVVALSNSHTISAQPPLLNAGWHYFDRLKSVMEFSMSLEKRSMLSAVLKPLLRESGDPLLIRRHVLEGSDNLRVAV